MPKGIQVLEPAEVNIFKKGDVFYPVKLPEQKLIPQKKAYQKGKQKTLFQDSRKLLDVSATFSPAVLRKLKILALYENPPPRVKQINHTIYHLVQTVIVPLQYKTFQMARFKPDWVPNPTPPPP